MIERSIEVNRENKDLMRQFLKSAETRYSVGKATQNDVLKAQVELSKLMNELVTFEQMKQTAMARVNALLNRPTRASLGTTVSKITSETRTFNWDDLEKLTIEKSPDLLEMQAAVKRQESSLRLSKLEYMPDLKIRSESRQYKGEGLREYDAFLGVTIPLWGFKKQRNQVKESRAFLEEAKANYESMKNAVLFEVQDALVRVESNQRLVVLYETSVLPQAQQSLKSAVAGYESDRNDFLSLIDAQRNLKTFQLEYYDSIVKLEQSLADLERAVGTDLEK
jgi:outer membrane protein TolC